ncbi:putative thioredoxin [Rhodofomes roseus]|uniref:Thioredoxin n=1 Tax=Rhodofomes roseus TaxID=34475 RepID=A0A4Y9XMX7_9APHY|nr:putative thioredoxin [Rhodofomes roseus]KAH9830499.1 putative thioredoxin [Rhodofomes roseus]TFY51445.1 hypothetical protein EVJ58_g10559 [Rhodofomes roseus]
MPVTVISSLAQFQEIISRDKPSVFDFWATWCGPCKQISPIFEKLAEQFPGADFYKVDVDEQGEVAQEVGIRAMPTFTVFKSGQKVKELVGANPGALQSLITEAAANA